MLWGLVILHFAFLMGGSIIFCAWQWLWECDRNTDHECGPLRRCVRAMTETGEGSLVPLCRKIVEDER